MKCEIKPFKLTVYLRRFSCFNSWNFFFFFEILIVNLLSSDVEKVRKGEGGTQKVMERSMSHSRHKLNEHVCIDKNPPKKFPNTTRFWRHFYEDIIYNYMVSWIPKIMIDVWCFELDRVMYKGLSTRKFDKIVKICGWSETVLLSRRN